MFIKNWEILWYNIKIHFTFFQSNETKKYSRSFIRIIGKVASNTIQVSSYNYFRISDIGVNMSQLINKIKNSCCVQKNHLSPFLWHFYETIKIQVFFNKRSSKKIYIYPKPNFAKMFTKLYNFFFEFQP